MPCLDPVVPAVAQTEQKTAPTGKQTARQEATATPVPGGKAMLLYISLQVSCWACLRPRCFKPKEGYEGRLERGEMRELCRCLQGASPVVGEAWEKTQTLQQLTKWDLQIMLPALVHSHRHAAALRALHSTALRQGDVG